MSLTTYATRPYMGSATVNFTSATRQIILATVVELTGLVPNVKVWFTQKDMPIPIRV